jgi:hypothetical protein
MATAPKFKIGDIVYLNESANLGELDAYKIDAIQQSLQGRWIYQIYIEKRPPDGQTVEDRVDLKLPRQLFFDEAELITLCQAVNTAVNNVQHRMNSTLNVLAAVCGGSAGTPVIKKGDSRYSIDETVYIKASAERGFTEFYHVTNIHKRPDVAEFMYELNIYGTARVTNNKLNLNKVFRQIFFREPELIDQCEALNIIVGALDHKIARLLAIKEAFCPSPEPSSDGSI